MTYPLAILAALLLLVSLDDWREHHSIQKAAVAEGVAVGENHQQITDSGENHDQELADLRAQLAARPAVAAAPVQLCRPIVQTVAAPSPVASPGPAAVPDVPGGDSQLRAEPGPDIRPLLELLAFQGGAVAADLKEQQSVQ